MELKYLPENTNPQLTDWLLSENEAAAQKLSVANLLSLAGTPTDIEIEDIEGLQTILDNKADDSDISALSSVIAAKASQSSVDGKIDKTLTEIITISADDFLILETVAGSNKKAKTSLIKNSPEITQTEPSSAIGGMLWNELDSSGNLVESWIRNKSRWYSGLKEYSGGIGNSVVNFSEYLAVDINKDIFIQDFFLHLYNVGSSSYAGNSYLYRENTSRTTIFTSAISTINASSRASYIHKINILYSPLASDCLIVQVARSGAGTGTILAGYKINYREVRK